MGGGNKDDHTSTPYTGHEPFVVGWLPPNVSGS